MKIKIQIGPYLLNLFSWEGFRFENFGNGSWCLFAGVVSLGRWNGFSGFSIGRCK